MNDIRLILIRSGDNLGELPIANLSVGIEPGVVEPDTTSLSQIACIYSRLADALAAEGFEVELDAVDFQITVSRALVQASEDGTITIPLDVRLIQDPVRSSPESNPKSETVSLPPQDAYDAAGCDSPITINFDELFDVGQDVGLLEGGRYHD